MSYSPNVAVPPVHYMSVHIGTPTTFISVFRGMDGERVRNSSGADRQNCKELFSIDQVRDGRYKLVHVTSSLPRSQRVRGVTASSTRIDQVLQRFVDSLQVSA